MREYLIAPEAPLSEAVARISDPARGIAVVVDPDGTLRGTVTDGDLRRALLAGVGMDAPVANAMHRAPKSAPEGLARGEYQQRMQEYGVFHLPLLDARGRVAGIARLAEFGPEQRFGNRVVLMAGGLGTRLRPLTNDRPKPMLPVGGRPVIQTIVERFIACGFYRFTISLNYLGEQIERHFGDGSALGVEVEYTRETKRLGTAGCVSLLAEPPEEPFFVMNGDILTTIDFRAMLDFHESSGAMATMAVNSYNHKIPYGLVDLEGTRILGIREKPTFSFFVAAGIYVLSPAAIDRIPKDEYFDMPSLFEALVAEGQKTLAFPVHEYWLDIGQPSDLDRAQAEYGDVFEAGQD